jgi:hypothetical protein
MPGGVLLVAMDDGAVAECVARLQAGGIAVTWVSDVYSAMGCLAREADLKRCLFDPAAADRVEREFLRIAPRYFPKLELTLLNRAGESGARSERIEGLAWQTLEVFGDEMLRSAAAALSAAVTADDVEGRPAASIARAGRPPESTTSPDDAAERRSGPDDEPTLHEAVRRRMIAGRSAPAARRRPPVERDTTSSKLTAAEVSALLNEDDAADETNDAAAPGTPDRKDGSGA